MEKVTKQSVLEGFLKKELIQVLEALGEKNVDESQTKKELIEKIMANECEIPHFVTEQDLEENPELANEEVKVGDVIFFSEAEANLNDGAGDDGKGDTSEKGTPPTSDGNGEPQVSSLTMMKENARFNGINYLKGKEYQLSTEEKEAFQNAGVI